ncbi:unnamed protein product [Urochloa humidicola]
MCASIFVTKHLGCIINSAARMDFLLLALLHALQPTKCRMVSSAVPFLAIRNRLLCFQRLEIPSVGFALCRDARESRYYFTAVAASQLVTTDDELFRCGQRSF